MSFGGRGRSSILPSNVESVAGDHDFHVVNFTPSVCLHVDIKPDEGEDMISYYRGQCCYRCYQIYYYRYFYARSYQFFLIYLQARRMFG